MEAEKKTTEAEEKALKITDVQIKRYWKKKEDERKAPRGPYHYGLLPTSLSPTETGLTRASLIVHQQVLTMDDKILREFDLSYQFGVGRSPELSQSNRICEAVLIRQ